MRAFIVLLLINIIFTGGSVAAEQGKPGVSDMRILKFSLYPPPPPPPRYYPPPPPAYVHKHRHHWYGNGYYPPPVYVYPPTVYYNGYNWRY